MKKWHFGPLNRSYRLAQWIPALRPHPVGALTGFHCIGQFYINTGIPVNATTVGQAQKFWS